MAGKNKFFKIFVNIIMTVLSCACILPFILLIMASITDETTLTLNGYSFFPARFSFTAYQYLFSAAGKILKAYGMTFLVTLLGTSLNVFFAGVYAVKEGFAWKRFFIFFHFFYYAF